jgi:hypothetical protein
MFLVKLAVRLRLDASQCHSLLSFSAALLEREVADSRQWSSAQHLTCVCMQGETAWGTVLNKTFTGAASRGWLFLHWMLSRCGGATPPPSLAAYPALA